MALIYNQVERLIKRSLWLCLLALLPISAHADFAKYGIYEGTTYTDVGTLYGTWNAAYQGMSITLAGAGTKANPYQITDEWELCYLEDQVNAGNSFKGKYFKLMNDIDLGGKIWYPIGVKSTTPFAGLFDGNDKTISNMSIVVRDADNSDYYSYGLFGYTKGVVRHLNMTNGYVVINRTDGNAAETLMAGLLCGSLTYNLNENIFGAVYECNIQGSIGGSISNYFNDTYIGGIAGFAYNPVSIYKCQAHVSMTPQDIRYVGGIVGWSSSQPELGERTNSFNTPCVAYIFDCVANVNIQAEVRETSMLYCGGICGASSGTLVACVANGTIECSQDDMYSLMVQPNMIMGGLTARNGYSIMNCVSTVQLKGGTTVGGLIGRNNNNTGLLVGDVLNSVFCGHIDSPNAEHTHGLVGVQYDESHAPFNCLFVGSMHAGTNKAPLSSGNTNKCYSDRNMYDDGSEWSCYTYTDEFDTATDSWFVSEFNCNVGWQSINTNSNWTYAVNIKDWVIKDGFYPYFEVSADNITTQGYFGDNVIAKATYYFDDNLKVARTPSLYQKYAWLGSVPMNVSNHAFRANFVDTPVSLAIKQQQLEGNNMKTATFSLTSDLVTVSGAPNAQTATPKDNVSGDVMLTITSDDNVSRNICLDVYTRHQWDGKVAKEYDGGNGTESNPYLIHNARQLTKAFKENEADEYFKLTKDIWYNENLLTTTGEPKDGAVVWNHETNRANNNWMAHLDGDSHLVHGLYSTNAFGLLEKIHNGASIENVGFVDCLVWSAEADPVNTNTGFERPFGFLTPSIGATAAVRNCLFNGVVKERRTNALQTDFGAFIHTIDNSEQQIGEKPIIEDCVLSIVAKSDIADRKPIHGLFSFMSGVTSNIAARRVLVLNDCNPESYLTPSGIHLVACHNPDGYLPYALYGSTDNQRTVSEMTDGTFFTGDGYSKWTARSGRFPVLTSFAATDYSKLIALPVYVSVDNRFSDMNYLMDFTPGSATWQVTNDDVIAIDTDIRVLEPKAASSSVFLVRSLNGFKVITPITTAAEITQGIKFEDNEAKMFCLAHYDSNGDKTVTLSELKAVTLDQFQQDMNEDDGNPSDNDGEEIARFPEFRYFAGIDDLGTSFHDKDKLEEVRLSGKITELSNNDFRGNSHMSSFTIPTSVTSVSGQAFSHSGLENYKVETDHTVFATVDGMLTNSAKDQLLSYPSGRQTTSITLPSHVTSIADNAIYKLPKVDTVFISTKDYKTVVDRTDNSIVHATDGKDMVYYIEDATNDDVLTADARSYQPRRRSSETGEGNGHLVGLYKANEKWKYAKLKSYYVLKVSENSKDANGNYWATMYIGFDIQLPEGFTPYTVQMKNGDSKTTLVLKKIKDRKVPMLTPVVIMAKEPGETKLLSTNNPKYDEIPMYENILEGVKRDSLQVNQSDSNDGGCLTLGRNNSGKIGFFIYKGVEKIPAYRAYISVNTVNNAHALLFETDNETTGVDEMEKWKNGKNEELGENEEFFDLKGQRREQPVKGLNVTKGRLFIKK